MAKYDDVRIASARTPRRSGASATGCTREIQVRASRLSAGRGGGDRGVHWSGVADTPRTVRREARPADLFRITGPALRRGGRAHVRPVRLINAGSRRRDHRWRSYRLFVGGE